MVIKTPISPARVPGVVRMFHLLECSRNGEVFWQSSAYANFDAVMLTIRKGQMTVSLSLHKHYYKDKEGTLDNSRMFTIRQALDAIGELVAQMGLTPPRCRVTYYEVGLNLPMSRDPLEYISAASGCVGREMFIDANYAKDRQRTTTREHGVRRIFKMYDKTWEARSKGREADDNILRLETIYRHQSITLEEFMSQAFIESVERLFHECWSALAFRRDVAAARPGIKRSQLEKARELIACGTSDAYLVECRRRLAGGELTPKMFRVCREFAQQWPELQTMFLLVPSDMEREYDDRFCEMFGRAVSGFVGK